MYFEKDENWVKNCQVIPLDVKSSELSTKFREKNNKYMKLHEINLNIYHNYNDYTIYEKRMMMHLSYDKLKLYKSIKRNNNFNHFLFAMNVMATDQIRFFRILSSCCYQTKELYQSMGCCFNKNIHWSQVFQHYKEFKVKNFDKNISVHENNFFFFVFFNNGERFFCIIVTLVVAKKVTYTVLIVWKNFFQQILFGSHEV